MKIKNKLKLNRGSTLADVIVAMLIIIVLGGTVVEMFYKIYFNNSMIRLNAMAVNYAINILEDIDEIDYDDVNENLDYVEKFDIPEIFTVSLNITKYNENDSYKEDIIKIVKLTIIYSLQNEEEEITITKLKIKEI